MIVQQEHSSGKKSNKRKLYEISISQQNIVHTAQCMKLIPWNQLIHILWNNWILKGIKVPKHDLFYSSSAITLISPFSSKSWKVLVFLCSFQWCIFQTLPAANPSTMPIHISFTTLGPFKVAWAIRGPAISFLVFKLVNSAGYKNIANIKPGSSLNFKMQTNPIKKNVILGNAGE